MFVKCDDLHSTNMEPLKCDKVYNTFFFSKNVYKLQAIVLNLLTIIIMDSYYFELVLIVVLLHIT